MPLVLSARRNPNYGSPLISQKYSPLQDILLTDGDRSLYTALFTARESLLRNRNVYPPNTLNLYGSWRAINPSVDPDVAPLVVISSGRAQWMRTQLLNAIKHGAFTGYLDATSFSEGLTPWYAPLRSGRRVYVVVHYTEYAYYLRALKFANVTVVGFKFTAAEGVLDIVGFGASRFAAVQLALTLGYHRLWTVDDNAVNINGFPNTLAEVEAFMPIEPASAIWAISFRGATKILPADEVWAKATFAQGDLNFPHTEPGLLQQAVLWNLDQLRTVNLNYSPLFVACNEDTSLSNHLRFKKYDHRIITACETIKCETTPDGVENTGATTALPARRNDLLQRLRTLEENTPIDAGSGERTLSAFIADQVLRNNGTVSQVNLTETQAIEQVLALAADRNWQSATTFNPYSGRPTVVKLMPAAL